MVRQQDILRQQMTISAFALACKRWNQMPKKNLQKIFTESAEKTLCGFAAEEFIARFLMPGIQPSEGEDIYHFDYWYHNKKMEIKNKCVNSIPSPEYEASYYTYHNPECDFFLFTRMKSVHKNDCLPKGFSLKDTIADEDMLAIAEALVKKYPIIYLLGVITKSDFDQKKYIVKVGSDLQYGQKAKGETWNVKISQLHPVNTVIDYHKKKSA